MCYNLDYLLRVISTGDSKMRCLNIPINEYNIPSGMLKSSLKKQSDLTERNKTIGRRSLFLAVDSFIEAMLRVETRHNRRVWQSSWYVASSFPSSPSPVLTSPHWVEYYQSSGPQCRFGKVGQHLQRFGKRKLMTTYSDCLW